VEEKVGVHSLGDLAWAASLCLIRRNVDVECSLGPERAGLLCPEAMGLTVDLATGQSKCFLRRGFFCCL